MAFEGKANRFAIAALSVVRNVQAFRAGSEFGSGGSYDCGERFAAPAAGGMPDNVASALGRGEGSLGGAEGEAVRADAELVVG